jgi:hypothetical protein
VSKFLDKEFIITHNSEELQLWEVTKSDQKGENAFFTIHNKTEFLGGYKTPIKMWDEDNIFGSAFDLSAWMTLNGDRIRIGGLEKFDLVKKSRKTVYLIPF